MAVHKHSFKNSELNQTSLSQHIHELKDKNIEFNFSWKIVDRGKPFSPISGKCDLCTKEKHHIIFKSDQTHLKSRNEMYSNYRHKQSVLISGQSPKKEKPRLNSQWTQLPPVCSMCYYSVVIACPKSPLVGWNFK